MAHHLFITASVRNDDSHSTRMGRGFCEAVKAAHPVATFTHRDVGITPPPHPTHAYTVANYTPPEERSTKMKATLQTSDQLIDELLQADTLIVAVPMYNFSVPSTFKAYIDNIVRVGRTFLPSENGGFRGVLGDKKAIFITARGAMYGEGSPIRDFDMQTPWLKTVFGFMGLEDMTFVNADGLDFGEASYRQKSLTTAEKHLSELAKTW
nr:NAD(P)H-dependent oxidoreductase [uncultured Celeribacter sp.]